MSTYFDNLTCYNPNNEYSLEPTFFPDETIEQVSSLLSDDDSLESMSFTTPKKRWSKENQYSSKLSLIPEQCFSYRKFYKSRKNGNLNGRNAENILTDYTKTYSEFGIDVKKLQKLIETGASHPDPNTTSLITSDDKKHQFMLIKGEQSGVVIDVLHKVKHLGKGSFGTVDSYTSIATHTQVAIKKVGEYNQESLVNEKDILQVLHTGKNNELIIDVEGIQDLPIALFSTENCMSSSRSRSLLEPQYDGNGRLLRDVTDHSYKFVSNVAFQIFSGLKVLREKQISQADIKTGNLLVKKLSDGNFIVHLSDFGGACFLLGYDDIENFIKQVYTPGYTCKEDLRFIYELSDEFNYLQDNDPNGLDDFGIKMKSFAFARDMYSCCYTLADIFIKDFRSITGSVTDYVKDDAFREDLLAAGFNDDLIDLVVRGLNPDYTQRPSVYEFLSILK